MPTMDGRENRDKELTDADSAGSTLFSIPEQELRSCPETPEHQAVCLNFLTKRLHNLGFVLPESLRGRQQFSCKAVMLTFETDVLFALKSLLDDYERVREERNDLRATEKVQRHELGRLSRNSESLERRLQAKEKKLADTEYRLSEQQGQADQLRTDVKREAQKARLAQSGMTRLKEEVRHRERQMERELFEAKQRVEQTESRRSPGGALGARGRRGRPGRPLGEQFRLPEALKPVKPTASHAHAVMAPDLFDAVELILPGQLSGCRRNRSVPSQIWYKVPAGKNAPEDKNAPEPSSRSSRCSENRGDEHSVMSIAETINASGTSWCYNKMGNSVISISSSACGERHSGGGRSRPNAVTELKS